MHILIVEDDPILLNVLEKDLSNHGHMVSATSNGKDGLLLTLHQSYDLVLLDVMLPEMDGFEILKRLREESRVPVLLLTARDELRDRVRGLDLGADDYLVKPFELEELHARIRALTRRVRGDATTVLKIYEGITFDQKTRVLKKDGVPVEMTLKELELIELFIQNQGRIVTRDIILNRIFDDGESGSNIVDVYIHKLRKKLGSDFLKTRRGLGFELPRFLR